MWSKRPTDFSKEVNADHRVMAIKTAIDLDKRLVAKTPVGDPSKWASSPPKGYTGGTARANWLPSIGSPMTTPIDVQDKSGAATIGKAVATFSAAPEFPVLYITNNVAYIGALNNGWSKQAPALFFESAIAEVNSVL